MDFNPSVHLLDDARRTLGMTVSELWVDYFALGGVLPQRHVRAVLDGDRDVEVGEYDVLAHALNERFLERDRDHPVQYRYEGRALPEI